jgi:hypothetical protein
MAYWRATRHLDVPMTYRCHACGYTAAVAVRGRGVATGRAPGQQLSSRAYEGAVKNAEMRCELAPCPRCGKRRFTLFAKSVRNTTLLLLAFVAVCAAAHYVSDPREFVYELGTTVAIGFAFELRASRSAVTFADSG